jgi:hypothetical protein
MMRDDWSTEENRIIVDEYVDMLKLELAGIPFVKSARNELVRPRLRNRSRGSVEFKHQNISAVLIALGLPYIEGYKPRGNFQDQLAEAVTARVLTDVELPTLVASIVAAPATTRKEGVYSFDDIWVAAPVREHSAGTVRETANLERTFSPVNYLEREARNASLGLAGEQFVLGFEHHRLWESGARKLADRLEHVSVIRGDGAGYDIMSFETDGRERLIEVKTTRFGAMTPFFATRNEVDVSESRAALYHVYRVFKFEEAPKLFVLSGSLRQVVRLEPVSYRASL